MGKITKISFIGFFVFTALILLFSHQASAYVAIDDGGGGQIGSLITQSYDCGTANGRIVPFIKVNDGYADSSLVQTIVVTDLNQSVRIEPMAKNIYCNAPNAGEKLVDATIYMTATNIITGTATYYGCLLPGNAATMYVSPSSIYSQTVSRFLQDAGKTWPAYGQSETAEITVRYTWNNPANPGVQGPGVHYKKNCNNSSETPRRASMYDDGQLIFKVKVVNQIPSVVCPAGSDRMPPGSVVPSGQTLEQYCYNYCPNGTRYPIAGDPNSCNGTGESPFIRASCVGDRLTLTWGGYGVYRADSTIDVTPIPLGDSFGVWSIQGNHSYVAAVYDVYNNTLDRIEGYLGCDSGPPPDPDPNAWVDLKVNGIDDALTVDVNSPLKLTWNSLYATNCSASSIGSSNWSGPKALNEFYGENHSEDSSTPRTITYYIQCIGNSGPGWFDIVTVTVLQKLSLSCAQFSGFSEYVQPGQVTSITFGFMNNPNSMPINNDKYPMQLSIPLININNAPVAYSENGITPIQPGHAGMATYAFTVPVSVSSIDVYWKITSVLDCTAKLSVSYKPYFRTYGSEVITGSGFKNTDTDKCIETKGQIRTFATTTQGSGSQYGVIATQSILGFISASNGTGTSKPQPPKGISFSNNTPTDQYGGNFGSGVPCITDYYYTTKDESLIQKTSIPQNLDNSGKVRYQLGTGAGTWTVLNGLRVNADSQAAIYVDGNLAITDNIILTGGAGTMSQQPNLAVIVKGNIYISSNVKRLDGLFVAQPNNVLDPNNGYIYTCTNGNAKYGVDALKNACSQQLIVNGALVAQRIKFLRTPNTLNDSIATVEVPNFKDGQANGLGSNTKAAEIINYNPLLYIAPSALKDPNSGCKLANCKYDAMYSLPPIY